MTASVEIGKQRRLSRLFPHRGSAIVVVPLDDSLIAGPVHGLANLPNAVRDICQEQPDAILGFRGLFKTAMDARETIPGILNITASTTRSLHTRKVLVGTPSEAVALGLDAVACHLNIGSKFESEQLSQTWQISRECELLGLPLVAIAYPRTETLTGEDDNFETLKRESPATYTEMVSHACRVAIELGADIVKTQYTGSPDTFSAVVAVCSPIPVLIAGGPLTSMANMLEVAFGAVSAGAAGVSFGRNVFASGEARLRIRALKAVVHDKAQPAEALNAAGLSK